MIDSRHINPSESPDEEHERFSPNHKYAVFWELMPNDKLGLYLAKTDNEHVTLLYKADRETVVDKLHVEGDLSSVYAWSPDNRKIAYLSIEDALDPKYFLTVIDLVSGIKQVRPVVPSRSTSKIKFLFNYGWSADSQYLAVSIRMDAEISEEDYYNVYESGSELIVWSGDDLSKNYSGIYLHPNDSAFAEPVGWSPMGHRLAIMLHRYEGLNGSVASPVIWSPEHGIESDISFEPDLYPYDNYFPSWSPNEQQLRVGMSGFVVNGEFVFSLDGKKTKRELESNLPPDKIGADIIGWAKKDVAIVIHYIVDKGVVYPADLFMIDEYTHHFETLAQQVFSAEISPDNKVLAYGYTADEKVVVKLMNLETHQQTTLLEIPMPKTSYGEELNLFWFPNGNFLKITWQKTGNNKIYKANVISLDGSMRYDFDTDYLKYLQGDWVTYTSTKNSNPSLEFLNLRTGHTVSFGKIPKSVDDPEYFRPSISITPDESMAVATFNHDVSLVALNGGNSRVDISMRKNVIEDSSSSYSYQYDFTDVNHVIAWSSDNSRIAYILRDSNSYQLQVIDRSGKEVYRTPLSILEEGDIMSLSWTNCN